MASMDGESLESWLNKATHRTNRQEDWEYIIGFCDQVNRELEGPKIAVRLLLHKICSSEWEALQALTVLEACMKNCGTRFHRELGRYRHLNQLVMLVSPMYCGATTPEKVKKKIIELVCTWKVSLPNETKINKAYLAFKGEGLAPHEEELSLDKTLIPSPPPRSKHPVFDNEDMGKLLAELLRSKNPEDLQEANRLIKNMVKEDEVRVQKVTNRAHTLEEVDINVKLLAEMLSHYDKDRSSDSDKEIIKELFERCDKLRRAAIKMATESEDNDSTLGDILKASDDLSRVINAYRRIVEGSILNSDDDEESHPTAHQTETTDTLIDLSDLDAPDAPLAALPLSLPVSTGLTPSPIPVLPPPPKRPVGARSSRRDDPPHEKTFASLLLDDELLSFGLNEPLSSISSRAKPSSAEVSSQRTPLQAPTVSMDMFGSLACSGSAAPSVEAPGTQSLQNQQNPAIWGVTDFQRFSGQTSATGSSIGVNAAPQPLAPAPLVSHPAASLLSRSPAAAPGSPVFRSLSSCQSSPQSSPARAADMPLSSVHVPLEVIRPSQMSAVIAFDKDGVRMLINFASDCPPGRPDVLVMVVSTLNTAPMPVHDVVLQAAVPKSMKVKLQLPSGSELAPFNPLLPPASVTQIMLLANPMKEKVRLRYKLSFTLGERQYNEAGEVDQFPPPESWGHL